MKTEVIFVADDFGMDAKVNEAIMYAHISGVLHGAALMMGQSGTDEAVGLARACLSLQTGWHLHLNDSQPSTRDRWPWGASPTRAGLSITLSPRARAIMRREIEQQWELFRATGLRCHFVNSHHHIHAHPVVYQTLREVLGTTFNGWIRLGDVHYFQPAFRPFSPASWVNTLFRRGRGLSTWRTTDTLWGIDRLFSMKAGEVQTAISTLPDGFHEFLFHPRNLSCPDTLCLLELKALLTR